MVGVPLNTSNLDIRRGRRGHLPRSTMGSVSTWLVLAANAASSSQHKVSQYENPGDI